MSFIENRITYSEFRRRCEDKNTLQHKGSMYIGTGKLVDGVYETAELLPPSKKAYLVSDENGNTRWDDLFVVISATDYNLLTQKDPTLMYFVYPD